MKVSLISIASSKELSKGQENFIGYYVEKENLDENEYKKIYESEIKGKFEQKDKITKEMIEEKYSKWI
jgi:hypothetical protein